MYDASSAPEQAMLPRGESVPLDGIDERSCEEKLTALL